MKFKFGMIHGLVEPNSMKKNGFWYRVYLGNQVLVEGFEDTKQAAQKDVKDFLRQLQKDISSMELEVIF